jgi:hypothetical protein
MVFSFLREARFCRDAVERTVRELGRLDILVSGQVAPPPGDSVPKASLTPAATARFQFTSWCLRSSFSFSIIFGGSSGGGVRRFSGLKVNS